MLQVQGASNPELNESGELAVATVLRAWNQARYRARHSAPALAESPIQRLVITFDGASPFHQGGRFTEATAGGLAVDEDSPVLSALTAELQGEFLWSAFLADARDAVARNGRVEFDVATGMTRILDLGAADRVDPNEVNIRGMAFYVVDILEDAWDYARREMAYGPHPELAAAHVDNIVLRFSPEGRSIDSVTADGVVLARDVLPRGALNEALVHPDWQEFLRECWWAVAGDGLVELRVQPPRARILRDR